MLNVQNLHQKIDASQYVYALNARLSRRIEEVTARVSALSEQESRPASFGRRWAVRALTTGAAAVLPVVPMGMAAGVLGVAAFGTGHDPEAKPARTRLMRGVQTLRQRGVCGLPELAALKLSVWALEHDQVRLHQASLVAAVGLCAMAQVVRLPVALTHTGMLLADGTAQVVAGVGVAAGQAAWRRLGLPSGERAAAN
jgi:hypothetical protein